jgi:hypothetical protein
MTALWPQLGPLDHRAVRVTRRVGADSHCDDERSEPIVARRQAGLPSLTCDVDRRARIASGGSCLRRRRRGQPRRPTDRAAWLRARARGALMVESVFLPFRASARRTVSTETGAARGRPRVSNRSQRLEAPQRRSDGRHRAHERRCRFLPVPVGRGSGQSAAGSTHAHRARQVPSARDRLMPRPSSSGSQAYQRMPTVPPRGQAQRPQQGPSVLSCPPPLPEWIYRIVRADSKSRLVCGDLVSWAAARESTPAVDFSPRLMPTNGRQQGDAGSAALSP